MEKNAGRGEGRLRQAHRESGRRGPAPPGPTDSLNLRRLAVSVRFAEQGHLQGDGAPTAYLQVRSRRACPGLRGSQTLLDEPAPRCGRQVHYVYSRPGPCPTWEVCYAVNTCGCLETSAHTGGSSPVPARAGGGLAPEPPLRATRPRKRRRRGPTGQRTPHPGAGCAPDCGCQAPHLAGAEGRPFSSLLI